MLYFKKIKNIGSAVSYKNRFLIFKRSARAQFIGLFLNKGCKLTTLKIINNTYLLFLHNFHQLNISNEFLQYFNTSGLDMGEFINLYNSFYLFRDWGRAIIWRIEENLPMIKVISKKLKKKKAKKKKKKKKFVLEYKYIKKGQRFQVALRWLSLLTKITSNKLMISLFKMFIPFIINPRQTKYVILKKKIYTSLLLSIQ